MLQTVCHSKMLTKKHQQTDYVEKMMVRRMQEGNRDILGVFVGEGQLRINYNTYFGFALLRSKWHKNSGKLKEDACHSDSLLKNMVIERHPEDLSVERSYFCAMWIDDALFQCIDILLCIFMLTSNITRG